MRNFDVGEQTISVSIGCYERMILTDYKYRHAVSALREIAHGKYMGKEDAISLLSMLEENEFDAEEAK